MAPLNSKESSHTRESRLELEEALEQALRHTWRLRDLHRQTKYPDCLWKGTNFQLPHYEPDWTPEARVPRRLNVVEAQEYTDAQASK